jgi:Domain of unknown function (DUF4908)
MQPDCRLFNDPNLQTRRTALRLGAGFVCAGALGVPGLAQAQSRPSDPEADAMAALVGGTMLRAEPWARFRMENGSGLILDRSLRNFALLKQDGEAEVWALRGTFGARGDEILRNDVGETMLRLTEFGGATFFGRGDTIGQAAAPVAGGEPIPRPTSSMGSLQATVEYALEWFDRYDPGNVRIEAQAGLPPGLVLDTFRNVSHAMQRMPAGWFNRAERKVRRLRIQAGQRPVVILQGGSLGIAITPGLSYAGRPSSAVVQNVFRNQMT